VSASLKRNRDAEGRSTDKEAGPRHFLDLRDFDPATLRQMLDVAANYKRGGVSSRPLAGKMLALIFEKPSTRTRVSFEVGARHAERPRRITRGHCARVVPVRRCDHASHRHRGEAA
jgi:ornithine carbamoyltransferase